MATFPTLGSGSMTVIAPLDVEAFAMYPATISHEFSTRVLQFLGDQEQRWTVHGELFSATLEYRNVNGYDMSIIMDFFRTHKGRYVNADLTNTFDITLLGQNYQYCCFDQDELVPIIERGETYSFTLKIRQLRRNT